MSAWRSAAPGVPGPPNASGGAPLSPLSEDQRVDGAPIESQWKEAFTADAAMGTPVGLSVSPVSPGTGVASASSPSDNLPGPTGWISCKGSPLDAPGCAAAAAGESRAPGLSLPAYDAAALPSRDQLSMRPGVFMVDDSPPRSARRSSRASNLESSCSVEPAGARAPEAGLPAEPPFATPRKTDSKGAAFAASNGPFNSGPQKRKRALNPEFMPCAASSDGSIQRPPAQHPGSSLLDPIAMVGQQITGAAALMRELDQRLSRCATALADAGRARQGDWEEGLRGWRFRLNVIGVCEWGWGWRPRGRCRFARGVLALSRAFSRSCACFQASSTPSAGVSSQVTQ